MSMSISLYAPKGIDFAVIKKQASELSQHQKKEKTTQCLNSINKKLEVLEDLFGKWAEVPDFTKAFNESTYADTVSEFDKAITELEQNLHEIEQSAAVSAKTTNLIKNLLAIVCAVAIVTFALLIGPKLLAVCAVPAALLIRTAIDRGWADHRTRKLVDTLNSFKEQLCNEFNGLKREKRICLNLLTQIQQRRQTTDHSDLCFSGKGSLTEGMVAQMSRSPLFASSSESSVEPSSFPTEDIDALVDERQTQYASLVETLNSVDAKTQETIEALLSRIDSLEQTLGEVSIPMETQIYLSELGQLTQKLDTIENKVSKIDNLEKNTQVISESFEDVNQKYLSLEKNMVSFETFAKAKEVLLQHDAQIKDLNIQLGEARQERIKHANTTNRLTKDLEKITEKYEFLLTDYMDLRNTVESNNQNQALKYRDLSKASNSSQEKAMSGKISEEFLEGSLHPLKRFDSQDSSDILERLRKMEEAYKTLYQYMEHVTKSVELGVITEDSFKIPPSIEVFG